MLALMQGPHSPRWPYHSEADQGINRGPEYQLMTGDELRSVEQEQSGWERTSRVNIHGE